jgi:hypothetical protein
MVVVEKRIIPDFVNQIPGLIGGKWPVLMVITRSP